MAGSLIKIDEQIVTSAVATVELGGTNWDSSYDVYMVKMNNVQTDYTGGGYQFTYLRVLTGGVAQTDANYDFAYKALLAPIAFQNSSATNSTSFTINQSGMEGSTTGESLNGIMYLFNFNNASEYSFGTLENVFVTYAGTTMGNNGGFVKTTAEANNGIQIYYTSGFNIDSGTFTLYGLKK